MRAPRQPNSDFWIDASLFSPADSTIQQNFQHQCHSCGGGAEGTDFQEAINGRLYFLWREVDAWMEA